jgi:cardiolipin synthase
VNRRDIPNLITFGRILLVPPIVWLLLHGEYGWCLVLFGVAGLSDGLDGFLAKRYDWTSRLGGLLDPIADKLLLISCFVALGYLGLIPVWAVALILVRDVVIVSGAVAYHFRVARLEASPSWVSKVNTVLQISLVLLVIYDQAFPGLPPYFLEILLIMVVIATVWSGVDYVTTWSRRAKEDQPEGPSHD